jgi:hypothetical protein
MIIIIYVYAAKTICLMYKSIKNLLRVIISISVSILLLPALIKVFNIDLRQYDILGSLLHNSQGIYVVISVLSAIVSAILLLLIADKEKKAKLVLTEAVNKDAIWDIDTLTYNTRLVFYKVQSAWNNSDITQVKDFATPEFLDWLKEQLKNKMADDEQDINFDITDTNIICCQDYLNNNKDRYEGYIQGNIVDTNSYTPDDTDVQDGSAKISFGNEDTGPKKFSEVYHFIRSENDWLLNKIDFKISIWGLLAERNKFEQ